MAQSAVNQFAPPWQPDAPVLGDREQPPTFHSRPQIEKHVKSSTFVHDAIIGIADGLTVPFALTAGLSSYVDLVLAPTSPGTGCPHHG